MHTSVPLGWIEQAEARSVREMALLHRASSEPCHGLAGHQTTLPDWFERLSRLVLRGPFTVPRERRLACDTAISAGRASNAASRTSPAETDAHRVLVTILITDIVESTKRAAEIGDRHWRALLDRHDDATRRHIARFGGTEVSNRGDGFLAMFDSPARAVRCAAAVAETVSPLGISLRSGVHVGEIDVNCNRTSGIAIHIAARIAAAARPGTLFVSETVRDLVIGSGLAFEDRGMHQLRGLPAKIHLYAMSAVAEIAS